MIWEKEREVGGNAAREEGDNEYRRTPPARAIVVGSDREQSVTSNDSRPSTCGAGCVGSAEGNDVEQQRMAVLAWKRREDAVEGAQERTGHGVLVDATAKNSGEYTR